MKNINVILIIFFSLLIACKEEKAKVKTTTTKTELHYICKNKCENSGSNMAGICATCNTPYVHNAAYHKDEFLKSGPLNVPSNALNPNQTTSAPNKTTPSPSQNAAGVFHYTCKNGCVGGAASASNCKVCGEALEHNTLYHNN
ncbi:hypothetical protein [uncultured Lutibacter sp.]|uniref:hypothetical protein n=1 Tax=uncultured Lutibacter sp. TaxID=437739 RepID=UPI002633ECA8|nr:hypothetical protein [uncultured Lutibacter sp.]